MRVPVVLVPPAAVLLALIRLLLLAALQGFLDLGLAGLFRRSGFQPGLAHRFLALPLFGHRLAHEVALRLAHRMLPGPPQAHPLSGAGRATQD